MLPEEPDTERLTDAQISDVLGLALASELGAELERLVSLPSQLLVQEVHAALEREDLGLLESSRLLGVNELTLKSWLDTPKTLPESAHQKLAAIGVLLQAAATLGPDQEVPSLVRKALSLARNQSARLPPATEEPPCVLSLAFGPSGLMAAALYLAVRH